MDLLEKWLEAKAKRDVFFVQHISVDSSWGGRGVLIESLPMSAHDNAEFDRLESDMAIAERRLTGSRRGTN